MFGLRLLLILAVMGGLIAFIGDKLGSKIGKKKLSVLGLRPYHTSILMTVLTGIIIAAITVITLAAASDSARTAMFGMEKLRSELTELNKAQNIAEQALTKAQKDIDDKNQLIESLDQAIKSTTEAKTAIERQLVMARQNYEETKEQLNLAQAEVGTLSESKKLLEKDVSNLETMTEELRKGIIAIREGEVIYRSGEVVYAGILKNGLNDEENRKQLELFLGTTNEVAMHRMGLPTDKPVQAILITNSNNNLKESLKQIQKSTDTVFVRVRAVANSISGELAVCMLEFIPNKRIYKNDDIIYAKQIDTNNKEQGIDGELLSFLGEVNKAAVTAGVIADPLTGKVGNVDAGTMIEISSKIRQLGGKVRVKALAKGDINVSGPVLLRLEVENNGRN